MKDDRIANRDTRVFLPGEPGYDEMVSSREHSVTENDPERLKRKTQIPDIPLELPPANVVDSGSKRHQRPREGNIPPRIPLPVNTSGSLTQLPAMQAMRTTLETSLDVRDESPWERYNALRDINRGGQALAAHTKESPCRMVIVKRITSPHLMNIKHLGERRHENLVALLEVYKFENMLFAVMEYTVVTLAQVIAIPLKLSETHVSCVCSQVLQGMKYLSEFGMVPTNLNCSKVLFSADGCAKIAYVGDCIRAGATDARPLGVIALEMMEDGTSSDDSQKLCLQHPDRWSAEASNFLDVASWGKLDDVVSHRFLKCLSPSVMVPFLECARWDTIESFELIG